MKAFSILGGFFVTAMILVASSQSVSAQTTNNTAPAQPPQPQMVVIQPGDSLAKIGKAHGTTHVRLFDANTQIANPDLIYPGESVRIPRADEKLASRTPAPPKQVTKPTTKAKSTKKAVVSANFDDGVWDRLAACESGGNWSTNTGNGYYGGVQFSLSTWRAVGGSGYPHEAGKAEQIKRAQILQARSGWGQWPSCSAKLGLR